MQEKTIVFAVNSVGLGHAVRCIPYVQTCLRRRHKVHIISRGRSLALLRSFFAGQVSRFFDLPDYSFELAYSRRSFSILRFLGVVLSPIIYRELAAERRAFLELDKEYNYDLVFSDTRYRVYKKTVPSFLFLYMAYVPLPGFLPDFFSRLFSILYNRTILDNHDKYFFNDYADIAKSLTGKILHDLNLILNQRKAVYLGPVSRHQPGSKKSKDIAQLIIISGPEPQRIVFEEIIRRQVKDLPGRTVVVLGKTDKQKQLVSARKNLQIYNYLPPAQLGDYLRRAETVVCRSGQGSIMDLHILRKKVLLVPTKGQPEQEYLGKFLHQKNGFYTVAQNKLNLPRDLAIVRNLPEPAKLPPYDSHNKVFIREVRRLAGWF